MSWSLLVEEELCSTCVPTAHAAAGVPVLPLSVCPSISATYPVSATPCPGGAALPGASGIRSWGTSEWCWHGQCTPTHSSKRVHSHTGKNVPAWLKNPGSILFGFIQRAFPEQEREKELCKYKKNLVPKFKSALNKTSAVRE